MSVKSTISIGFVIEDGKNGLKELAVDANALRKIMAENVEVTKQLSDKIFKFAAAATAINVARDSLPDFRIP